MAKSQSFIDKLAVTIKYGKNRVPLERHDTDELKAIAKYIGLRGKDFALHSNLLNCHSSLPKWEDSMVQNGAKKKSR